MLGFHQSLELEAIGAAADKSPQLLQRKREYIFIIHIQLKIEAGC